MLRRRRAERSIASLRRRVVQPDTAAMHLSESEIGCPFACRFCLQSMLPVMVWAAGKDRGDVSSRAGGAVSGDQSAGHSARFSQHDEICLTGYPALARASGGGE